MSTELKSLLEHAISSQTKEGKVIGNANDVSELIQKSWSLVSNWYVESGVDVKSLLATVKSKAKSVEGSDLKPLIRSCMLGDKKSFLDFARMLLSEENVLKIEQGLDPSILGFLDSAAKSCSERLKSSASRKKSMIIIEQCTPKGLKALLSEYNMNEDDREKVLVVMKSMGFEEFDMENVRSSLCETIDKYAETLLAVRNYAIQVFETADEVGLDIKREKKNAKKTSGKRKK